MLIYKKAGIRGAWIRWFVCILLSLLHGVISETSRALDIMTKYPLIDGHNDLALRLRMHHNNKLSTFNMHHNPKVATDISRLTAGHVGGQVFAAYVLCTAQDKDAVRLTLEQIDVIRRICTENPELELVTTAEGMRTSTKIACLISIEGGHSIDSSLAALRMFYQLGVRSMALTHNCNTPWAESSSSYYTYYQQKNNSLTDFGKAVVNEMNRLGMLVDLSHSSWETARAVLKHSTAPVIFSHSSAYAICNNIRNVPNEQLLLLKENGGLIMVNFYSSFVACSNNANVSVVADHFDHLKQVIGAESIGIGADFDGAQGFPKGLEDVSKYPALIEELISRNWTEEELAGVLRLNFLRVFRKVEKVRKFILVSSSQFNEVRDDMLYNLPSEAEISLSEVNKSCRAMLVHPSSHRNGNAPLTPVKALICFILFLIQLK
ncbi:dipeptidase 2-like isoform X1 [Sinocyclocheilus rhinocerous]|uniref:dipeptidase 2-like isoform X1 n=2 Tax=Sinocyclocheilus rhinocerous TaxID=307959 RepID=UPI0007B8F96D|nr:PREDICTED: dipeptidase 2-like isoform X1 [Sinocyclocheilus rhinocerous]